MKSKYKLVLLAIATTAFSMFQQQDAKAGITYCNRSNEIIWVTHAYALDLRTVRTTGWWKIVPGVCKEVYIGPAADVIKEAGQTDRVRLQMFHAYSDSGRRWGSSRKDFCVTQSEFQLDRFFDSVHDRKDSRPCPKGYSMQGFKQIQVQREDKTIYFGN